MIGLFAAHVGGVDHGERIPRSIRVGIAVIVVALGTGCAHGGTPGEPSASQPVDYEVRNTTSCYARISSVDSSGRGGGYFIADLAPGQRTVVTIGAGRRIHTITHKEPGAEPGQPGADCRGSGEVKVRRVASGS